MTKEAASCACRKSANAEGEGGGENDDSASGDSPLLGRALLVTALWSPRDGTVLGLQREYDAGGDLVEVRARTAVITEASASTA